MPKTSKIIADVLMLLLLEFLQFMTFYLRGHVFRSLLIVHFYNYKGDYWPCLFRAQPTCKMWICSSVKVVRLRFDFRFLAFPSVSQQSPSFEEPEPPEKKCTLLTKNPQIISRKNPRIEVTYFHNLQISRFNSNPL